MFFLFSKILEFLLSPLFWIIAIMTFALITKEPSRKGKLFARGFMLLLIFTNPFLINMVMKWWESPSYKESDIKITYDVGVVLGGATKYYNIATERPVYSSALDRVIQAVSLYHSGKIKKILITGGSGFILDQKIKEADLLRQTLLTMNIPDSDIVLERESRNTYENAKFTAALLKSNLYGKRYLIITSAFHIRRTMACFRKQGIIGDVYPVDEHSGSVSLIPDSWLLPSELALHNWDILIHEWSGMLMYKLSGYI